MEKCPICDQNINQKSELECNHAFCELCIKKWFESKRNCPICREESNKFPEIEASRVRYEEIQVDPEDLEDLPESDEEVEEEIIITRNRQYSNRNGNPEDDDIDYDLTDSDEDVYEEWLAKRREQKERNKHFGNYRPHYGNYLPIYLPISTEESHIENIVCNSGITNAEMEWIIDQVNGAVDY